MALLYNHIVFDPDNYTPPGDLSGAYLFDDMIGDFQPKCEQLEILLRPGSDGEELRATGIRAVPTRLLTVRYLASRSDALAAMEQYVTLADGVAYEIINHGQSWGYFRLAAPPSARPLLPALAIGTITANPTVCQIIEWAWISTDDPEP